MKRQDSQSGFSLVQLVVTLQFASIVALMAVPNVNATFAQYQLMSASNQLGFDVARARMQAVGQNRFVHIMMLSDSQYARETSADGNTWSNRITTDLPKGVTTTTTSAEVRFDRRGFTTVNQSIIVKNRLQQQRTIQTSVVGQITIT